MNEADADLKRAGQLLLEGLHEFNQAAVLFSEYIEPDFERSVENVVSDFAKDQRLSFELDWKNGQHWFAHQAWTLDGERTAQFEDYMPGEGEDDYWLAVATGTGTRQVEWGYRFTPLRGCFGGTQSFNRWVKHQDGALIGSITELGFRYEGKGEFFIPVKFDARMLGSCWKEYGGFREEHELFNPLKEVLEIIQKALPHFSALLNKAFADLSPDETVK